MALLKEKNIEIMNIDSVVIAEEPKLSPFIDSIRSNVASHLGIPVEDFNVKAKTSEKTGEVGRGEAMECYCVAMVRSGE
jgi:2-C-methyl-D-erythritol 2,4-cyclodiphosphate synthase